MNFSRRRLITGAAALAAYSALPGGARASKLTVLSRLPPFTSGMVGQVNGAFMFFDPATDAAVDSSGNVSSITDEIDGSFQWSQSTAGLRPPLIWGVNGARAIRSDGTRWLRNSNHIPTPAPTGSSSSSLFLLVDQQNAASDASLTNRTAFAYGPTGTAARRISKQHVAAPGNRLLVGESATAVDTGGAYDFSGICAVWAFFDGSSTPGVLSGRINGVALSPTNTVTLNTGANRTTIFANNSGTAAEFFVGDLYEALGLFDVPTLAQAQQIEAGALWRLGLQSKLPNDHPYRLVRPAAPYVTASTPPPPPGPNNVVDENQNLIVNEAGAGIQTDQGAP